jgi:hypothetical protein
MPDVDSALSILTAAPAPADDAGAPSPAAPASPVDQALGMLSASPDELQKQINTAGPDHSVNRSLRNVGAGIDTGLIANNPLAGLVDLTTAGLNIIPHALGYAGITNPIGGSQSNNALLAKAGIGTGAVPAQDAEDRIEQNIGGGIGGALDMYGGASILAPLARAGSLGEAAVNAATTGGAAGNAALGAAAGAGGGVAEEMVPDQYKPLANAVGQLAGGGGLAAGAGIAQGLGRAAVKSIDYFRMPATEAGQQQLAGQRILGAASDPAAVKAALDQPAPQLVPGSNPTTPEVTGDLGIAQLARSAITPENFKGMQAGRNAARIGSLEDTAPAQANPEAVGQLFRDQMDAADKTADQHVAGLQTVAQGQAVALGGNASAQDAGAGMRSLLSQANTVAKDRESQLWQAVDPDGTLGVPTGDLKQSAAEIGMAMPGTAKPMAGEESALHSTIADLPPTIPFQDFGALWSRVQAEIRAQRMTGGGETPEVRRLGQLRDALGETLQNATTAAAHGEAAATGAPTGIASRTQALDDLYNQGIGPGFAGEIARAYANSPSATRNAGLGEGPARSIVGLADVGDGRGGAPSLPGVRGGARAGERGLGNATGAESVPPEVPPALTPFDQAAQDRYAEARTATRERKQTYVAGPVGRVLAPGPAGTPYRMPESRVAQTFASSPEGIQAYIKAAGGRPEATALLHDYLASTLPRLPDGTINPAAFPRWLDRAKKSGVIDAFPELGARFGDAAAAQRAVEEAGAAHAAEKKARERSAASLFIGNDPTTAVRKALSVGGNGEAAFKELAQRVKGNPEAEQGLKRAVVEFVRQRMESTVKDIQTGYGNISNSAFQKFIDQKLPALRHVFNADQIKAIRAIAEDMSRENSFTSGSKMPGSNTPQDLKNASRFGGVRSMLGHLGEDMGGFLIAEHLTGHMTGGIVGLMASKIGNKLREAGLRRVDQLVEEAMLDPALARTLVAKVTPKNQVSLIDRLGNQIAGVSARAGVSSQQQEDPKERAYRAVAAMAPGEYVTGNVLARVGGAENIKAIRDRLVARGVIEQRSGRYVRAETVNPARTVAPVASQPGLTVNPELFNRVYDAIRERAPTLRKQSFNDLQSEIEARQSPIHGTYRPGGLVEHVASLGEGTPVTHDVVHLLRRTAAIPRPEWAALSRKADDWAKQFAVDEKNPRLRGEEAVARAYNAYRVGALRLPPGLRRIMDGISGLAASATA